MPTYRAMFTMRATNGVPRDNFVNTWYCVGDDVSAAETFVSNVEEHIYQGLNTYFSEALHQNTHNIRVYDLADSEPRAPVYERDFNLPSTPSGESLPTELAICLSFQGVQISGVPQARRRGRVYLGPFDASTSVDGRPSTAFASQVAASGDALLAASVSALDYNWCVYSPTGNSTVTVNNGWVDDAWDIQRRRGIDPSARWTFS